MGRLWVAAIALVLAVAVSVACPFASPVSADGANAEPPRGGMVIRRMPLTVEFRLNEPLKAQVADALSVSPPRTIRLSVRGVKPPDRRAAVRGVNVFVNKPDADTTTSDSDPHFAAALVFSPTGSPAPQAFSLDLGPTLAKLRRRDELDLSKPIIITLAATLPEGERAPADDVSISVGDVTLEVPGPHRRPSESSSDPKKGSSD